MAKGTATIINETGMHARPASKLVGIATKHVDSNVIISKGDKTANAKSMLNILALAMKKGDVLTVEVTGGEEEKALNEIISFISEFSE